MVKQAMAAEEEEEEAGPVSGAGGPVLRAPHLPASTRAYAASLQRFVDSVQDEGTDDE